MTGADSEWAAAMTSLRVSEKVRIKPSIRQHKEKEWDCRTVVQRIVFSFPQSVLMRTSYKTKEQEIRTQKKTVTFETPDDGLTEVESKHSEQDNLSG